MLILLAGGGGTLSIGVVFWILMLLWLFFGLYSIWGPTPNYRLYGNHLLLWFLLFLLGWGEFGFPIGR
jgi:hypothetical protein